MFVENKSLVSTERLEYEAKIAYSYYRFVSVVSLSQSDLCEK